MGWHYVSELLPLTDMLFIPQSPSACSVLPLHCNKDVCTTQGSTRDLRTVQYTSLKYSQTHISPSILSVPKLFMTYLSAFNFLACWRCKNLRASVSCDPVWMSCRMYNTTGYAAHQSCSRAYNHNIQFALNVREQQQTRIHNLIHVAVSELGTREAHEFRKQMNKAVNMNVFVRSRAVVLTYIFPAVALAATVGFRWPFCINHTKKAVKFKYTLKLYQYFLI
jgi:hypothetical protein